MPVKIGPIIGVEGETQFRAAFKEMIAQVKEFDAEMTKLTATFTHNDSELKKNADLQKTLTDKISKQKDALQKAKEIRDKATAADEKATAAYQKQKAKVEELLPLYDKAKDKYQKLKEQYGEDHPITKGAESVVKSIESEIRELDALETKMYHAGQVSAEWGAEVDIETAKLAEMQKELEKIPNALETMGSKLQTTGATISDFGDKLTTAITLPLAAFGAYSVKAASDFEDGMAKIYTIAIDSTEPMEKMREELIALSNETGFGLDDLTEATYQAVSASVDAGDAVEFMTQATKLARAGFTSTTEAVDLLTTVINAYGYSIEDVSYISDVLLKTQNDGKTIIDDLAWSMGTVIPTASNYGVSLEQLAAAYATMTKQGVNTSRATTFLNAMFTELEKEGSTVSDVLFNETGKSFAQLMNDGYSLADVLEILYDSVGRDDEQFQRLFGNIRSGKAGAALLRDDFGVLRYEIERMGNATGQTEKALAVLETPSLHAKRALNQLKNSAVEVGQTLIDEFLPVFEDIVQHIKDFTKWFGSLNDDTKILIVNTGLVIAAVGPLLSIGGRLISGAGKVLETMGKINKAIEFGTPLVEGLSNAFVLTVGSIAAVGTAYLGLGVLAKVGLDTRYKEIEAQWGLTSSMEATIESIHKTRESYEEAKKAADDYLETVDANIVVAEDLIDRYNELIDENGLVKEGHEEEAKVLVDLLAEALGITSEEVMELTEENGKLGASIEELISKMRREAEMQAYKELLTEAIKNQAQAERDLEQAEKDHQVTTEKLQEAQDNYNKAYAEAQKLLQEGSITVDEYNRMIDDEIVALSYAKDAYNETGEAVDLAHESLDMYYADAETYEGRIATLAYGEEKAVADTAQKMGESYAKIQTDHKTAYDKMVSEQNEKLNTIEARIKRSTGKAQHEMNETKRVFSNAWFKVANDVKPHMETFDKNLSAGLDSAIKTATVKAMKLNDRVSEGLDVDSYLKGANIAIGLGNGIENNASYAVQKAQALANAVSGIMNLALKIGSPSKVMWDIGKWIDLGLAEGIEDNMASVQNAGMLLSLAPVPDANTITYNSPSISAPISVNINVNGSVDNPRALAEMVGNEIMNSIRRESEVFA